MRIIGREQPDVLAQRLDAVLERSLSGIDGTEEPPLRDDFGRRAIQIRRHARGGPVVVVEPLDQPRHPASATLEHTDSELREQIEKATTDKGAQGSLPAPPVIDRTDKKACIVEVGRARRQRWAHRSAVDPQGQV